LATPRTIPKLAGPDLAAIGQQNMSNNRFGPSVPTLRRRRNVPGAVLGVLVVAVCAFGIGSWALSVGHRTQVLVVARFVPAGSVIQVSDLTTAGVSADHAVAAMPVAMSGQVVGRVVADNLVPGTLLVRAELSSGPQVPVGSSVVGLDLKPGMFPIGVQPGTTVSVVSTSVQSGTGSAGSVLVGTAKVFSTSLSPDGTSTLVSVVVPSSQAAAVATANAQGGVSLVMLPGPGA
jgi:hypothetical protein